MPDGDGEGRKRPLVLLGFGAGVAVACVIWGGLIAIRWITGPLRGAVGSLAAAALGGGLVWLAVEPIRSIAQENPGRFAAAALVGLALTMLAINRFFF